MKNKDVVEEQWVDKTKIFLGIQEEMRIVSENKGRPVKKVDVTQILRPYFDNEKALKRAGGTGLFATEAAFLARHRNDSWVHDVVSNIIAEYKTACAADADKCLKLWLEVQNKYAQSARNWSVVARLQKGRGELENEVWVQSSFRDLGDMLEGSVKILLRLRLETRDVAGLRRPNAPLVSQMTFGQIVEELSQTTNTGNLYQTPVHSLFLSQWRNIANHNNYHLTGDNIVCELGAEGRGRKIEFTISEFESLLRYCNELAHAHKVACELIMANDLEKFKKKPEGISVEISQYSLDCNLAISIVGEGFEILQADSKPAVWALALIDRLGRSEIESKQALQRAVVTYNLICGTFQLNAIVQSDKRSYQFNFRCEMRSRENPLPDDFEGSIARLDEYYNATDFEIIGAKTI